MDPETVVGFSPDDAKRVARATVEFEKWPAAPQSGGRNRGGLAPDNGVWCINDSGEQIPPMSIACADTLKADLDYGGMKLKKPGTTFRKRLIITGEGFIESGKPLWFPTQRFYRVKYDSGTPAPDEGWGPKPGQWTISKGFPGCVIEGILDATNKIALVSLLSPIVTLLGKASGSITARSGTTPGTGSMEIWYNNAGTLTDAGFADITVKNLSASAVTSGGYIQAKWIGSYWFVDFEDCP